ncbi:hypothetical protein A1OO_15735 [Enterovibrio norvegicus FF-33]|uniref:hypothetical protein n=1 Tax=Enterovibrio TaxID=188143 RepID=UPI0002F4B5AB|nr:hypothetical protein [Enterovibrio norvegicus]OEE67207.1 hypothetical protein A1OO_15735 [Enterovibrio norvegicus FF-33]OEE86976.1 hypothetical protein A1OQ_16145 [Enterovibrio norvegicus FF-162]
MAEQNDTLYCEDCGQVTLHMHIQLEPRKISPDSTFFQRATIVLSNSMDLMLGSAYEQCTCCGSTFGYTDSIGGI